MKTQDQMSSMEFFEMFPTEESAVEWFEKIRWANGRYCPHCNSTDTYAVASKKPQPYRCRDKKCRKYFSATVGTVLASKKLPVRKWLYAMYLMSVAKKGLSSLQMARELRVSQETAWRLGHKIREAWNCGALFPMSGEVEVDETYIGGKERNKHESKKLRAGRGAVGKAPVVGIMSRDGEVLARPVAAVNQQTLHGEIEANVAPGSTVYTDEHGGYRGMRQFRHETVAHSAGEYVNDRCHTNGIESFWSLLKRGYQGSYHKMSVKHLSRYVDEFAYRWNNRDLHATAFMERAIRSMIGRSLTHRALVDGDGS